MYTKRERYTGAKMTLMVMLLFIGSSAVSSMLHAQAVLQADGQIHTVNSKKELFQDFVVPGADSFGRLILEVEGADGGWIEYMYKDRFNVERTQRVNAGEGATVSASYPIGTGLGAVPAGAIIRMIIGTKGQWAKYDLLPDGYYGAGAGGGSAILLSTDGGSSWQILMVAAGGGGAGVQKQSGEIKFNPGLPGSSAENGIGGERTLGAAAGGTFGSGGESVGNTGGGGGAYADGMHAAGTLYYGNAGWKDHKLSGQPLGGLGGTATAGRNGGYGFGGGGSGAEGGGGGGGFSGGGGGMPGYGGGGGGSFVATSVLVASNILKQENGNTNNPDDGYVRYQFVSVHNK